MSNSYTVAKLEVVKSERNIPLHSTLCDVPTPKAASKLKSNRLVSPTSAKNNTKTSPSSVIDITGSEPAPLFIIKNEHPLFFSYDPRGTKKIKRSGIDYCEDCLCPKKYCAEVVFGTMTAKRTMSLLKQEGLDDYDDEDDIATEYSKVYTNFIINKMSWNNISFRYFDDDIPLGSPRCMQRGSLTQLCYEVQEKRDEDADAVWGGDLDMSEKELDDFVATVVLNRNGPPPPEDGKDSDIEDCIDVSSVAKRTAIEQASDVGPMFKRMKQKLRAYTTSEV